MSVSQNCIDGTALDAELIQIELDCTTALFILTYCAYGIYFLDHTMCKTVSFHTFYFSIQTHKIDNVYR